MLNKVVIFIFEYNNHWYYNIVYMKMTYYFRSQNIIIIHHLISTIDVGQ